MKKSLQKLFTLSIATLLSMQSFSQNQVYWREGFEPSQGCNLTNTAPTAFSSSYFQSGTGTWYGGGIYRTNGTIGTTACAGTGVAHVRFQSITGATDSGYLVTPIVDAGINELHFTRTRSTRNFTIWITNDTLPTTLNWKVVTQVKSSPNTCADSMITINSATAKRLKIVARPGVSSDIDSIWLTSVAAILPVKFGAISASEANSVVKLNWNIETEINTKSYIIERSKNGEAYTQIGTLTANKSANYAWMDKEATNGVNFYRIVAIDNNGTKQYSAAVRLNIGKTQTGLNVYPNPVTGGQLNVELTGISKGNYKANIYAMNGALVHTATIASEGTSMVKSITLPNAIIAGNYTLEITNGSFKTVKSIVIN
jgi:Secretion system C-terminal sorting domain